MEEQFEKEKERCPVCGRENPIDGANFCYYCGTRFQENQKALEQEISPNSDFVNQEFQNAGQMPLQEETEKTGKEMSTLRWFLLFASLLIPVYGWLVFVVMTVIHAFDTRGTLERRRMSRGMLIFLVIFIIYMIAALSIVQNSPEFREYYNELMNQYNTSGGGLIMPFR